jgi:hypothetical protein
MTHPRHEVSVGFSEQRFLSGSHICLLYSSDEERLGVLARFFEAGRREHERMMYAYAGDDDGEARAGLLRHGFVCGRDVRTRPADQVYYPQGQFSPEHVLEQTRRFFEGALAEGFSGGRASGELMGPPGAQPGRERLMVFEARLTELLAQYPATVVCQYDVRRFDGETISDILSVHPYAIVHGHLLWNPYHVEPDRFLAGRIDCGGFPSAS